MKDKLEKSPEYNKNGNFDFNININDVVKNKAHEINSTMALDESMKL